MQDDDWTKAFSIMLFLSGILIFLEGLGNVWFGNHSRFPFLFELGWVLGIIGLLIILGAFQMWPSGAASKGDVKSP